MSSQGFKAARTSARRNARRNAAGRLGLLALLLSLSVPALFYAVARAQVRPTAVKAKPQAPVQTAAPAPDAIKSMRIQPASVTKVNFKQLADLAKRVRISPTTTPVLRAIPAPGSIKDSTPGTPFASAAPADTSVAPGPALEQAAPVGPLAPSPSPSQNFLAQEDGPKIGSAGTFTIPPDTNGSVGLDRVFTNTNSNYRIHDKLTGAPLSTVSTDTFWAPSGASNFFDPQIQFDPYNQRWILAITSNPSSVTSSINVAVSQTSDPAGSYNIYRYIVGCANGSADCASGGEYADYPMLGFNKDKIVVSVNMFQIIGSGAGGAQQNNDFRVLVLDYPQARAGAASPGSQIFFGTAIGFCNHPVTTYSATEGVVYLIRHVNNSGLYAVYSIAGPAASPSFTLVTPSGKTRPGGGWTQLGGDLLPQQCVPGVGLPTQTCPATPRRIEASDTFIRSNPVFRNGKIYYAQAIGLPATGATANNFRAVAQWTVVNATTGDFVDGGRVEDPTATPLNGGKHYSYPSLTVNKNGDIQMGFSEFESDDYVDAGYTFRLASDPAGTMRDPVIYKEGEDYYEKTFSGTRNRWGDYSHTVVDPVNDRDMWTVQEYAGTRVGATGTGSNDSRWGTWWAKVTAPASAGELLISEFRLFGPNGPPPPTLGAAAPEPNNDEFIEIYNNNDTPLTVATADGSAGYSVAASDGVIRCTIPNGTTIPARGHYLCANSAGYSLGGYPAGNGTTATPDGAYTVNIPNNVGIAVFNTANTANYSTATRLDAAGSASEANALYKKGTGYPALTQYLIEHSLYRDTCGKQGSTTAGAGCPTGGYPADTGNNAVDFVYVDTKATPQAAGQRLGAPGPENLSSPIQRNDKIPGGNLDPAVGSSSPPNRVRDFTSDGPNNSTYGTMRIRKTITNNTGAPITRLRFRIIDQTTFPVPAGYADLRARTSSATPAVPDVVTITGPNPACPSNTCTVQHTTLEEPPAQPNGGAFNSTLSVGTVTLGAPVPNGSSINIQFLLGIQQTGAFRFYVNIEVLP
jgi:hypothetical protein